MPTQLQLPSSVWSVAWEQVLTVLKTDPTLKRVVRTWRTWSGDNDDAAEDGSLPTVAQMPWVMISPDAGPAITEAVMLVKAPIYLKIEVAVKGTAIQDAMNLYGAICTALFPQDMAVRQVLEANLRAAGIYAKVIHQPAFRTQLVGGNVKALFAEGLIEIKVFLPA